jgi:hypothetical protein
MEPVSSAGLLPTGRRHVSDVGKGGTMSVKSVMAHLQYAYMRSQLFELGAFVNYRGRLIATTHITQNGEIAILPVEWNKEGTTWSYDLTCKIVPLWSIERELFDLVNNRAKFHLSATGCIKCNERQGVYHHNESGIKSRWHCPSCEKEYQASLKRFEASLFDQSERHDLWLERRETPCGIVAALYEMPFSSLKEVRRTDEFAYVVNSVYAWEVPVQLFAEDVHMQWAAVFHIRQIDRYTKRLVGTMLVNYQEILDKSRENEEFILA